MDRSPSNCSPVPKQSRVPAHISPCHPINASFLQGSRPHREQLNPDAPHHYTAVVRLRASRGYPLAAIKRKLRRLNVRLPKKQHSTNRSSCMAHPWVVVCLCGSQFSNRVTECDVIAVHTRPRQFVSLNLQGVQGSVAEDPAYACSMQSSLALCTANLQAIPSRCFKCGVLLDFTLRKVTGHFFSTLRLVSRLFSIARVERLGRKSFGCSRPSRLFCCWETIVRLPSDSFCHPQLVDVLAG
jgi:hypothetical protein